MAVTEKKSRKFVVYAHRGASEYAPENTMSSFYLGLHMGANGIETDIRKTKDGVLVLFHDKTLERVMDREGQVEDLTYDELTRIPVLHPSSDKKDYIVRLEDFLRYIGAQDITLALELKAPDIERDTYEMIKKFNLEDKVIVTSFQLEYLIRFKEICSDINLGYLTQDFDNELLDKMREVGIGQLCPAGANLTPEKVASWHNAGFNVRAWGIKNVEIMKHAYDSGVDGMTVNFPDRLIEYIIRKG